MHKTERMRKNRLTKMEKQDIITKLSKRQVKNTLKVDDFGVEIEF